MMSERSDRARRASGFPLLLALAVAIGAIVLVPSIRALVEQQAQVDELSQSVAQQRRDLAELRAQEKRWEDPAYIRAQSRQRLYFVVPGERTYNVIVDGEPREERVETRAAQQKPADHIQSTDYLWTDQLGASLIQSGQPE